MYVCVWQCVWLYGSVCVCVWGKTCFCPSANLYKIQFFRRSSYLVHRTSVSTAVYSLRVYRIYFYWVCMGVCVCVLFKHSSKRGAVCLKGKSDSEKASAPPFGICWHTFWRACIYWCMLGVTWLNKYVSIVFKTIDFVRTVNGAAIALVIAYLFMSLGPNRVRNAFVSPPTTRRNLCHEAWTNLRLSPMFGCICPNNHMKRRCDRIFAMVNHNPCVGKWILIWLFGVRAR